MTTATCYTVHDRLGFDALPAGTKLEDADGDHFEKMEEGYRAYGDDAPYYGYLYLSEPAVVLNPEVLGTFPPSVGDRAIIDGDTPAGVGFRGLTVEVVKVREDAAWVQPLSERPDGHGLSPFYWGTDELVPFTPEPLKKGDRVRRISDTHYISNLNTFDYGFTECEKGSVGTVTGYTTTRGDGVGVDWDHGRFSVISSSQLAPYVDPEPEPVYENFELTGAYVVGQEALDALPALSIVDPLGAYLPMLKLNSGEWVSIGHVSQAGATRSAPWVQSSLAERGGVVLYGNPKNA